MYLQEGDLFYFNANMCTHYNECNQEEKLRISLDFRIMEYDNYMAYLKNNDLKLTHEIYKEKENQP